MPISELAERGDLQARAMLGFEQMLFSKQTCPAIAGDGGQRESRPVALKR
jgi:hypothetical protein